jgi:hypothetical protein
MLSDVYAVAFFIVMLNVIMLSIIILNLVPLCVIMPSVMPNKNLLVLYLF